jgi:hypothetical protein
MSHRKICSIREALRFADANLAEIPGRAIASDVSVDPDWPPNLYEVDGVPPVTIFTPRLSRIWPARPGMILAPSRSHDPGGVVTGPGGWLVIANRGSARIS